MTTHLLHSLIMACALSQGEAAQAGAVGVSLKISDSAPTLGDEIYFTVVVKNNSAEPVKLPSPPNFDISSISLTFTDEATKRIYTFSKMKGDMFVRERKPAFEITIAPSEEVKTFIRFVPPYAGKFSVAAELSYSPKNLVSRTKTMEVRPAKSGDDEQTNLGAIITLSFAKDGKTDTESFMIRFFPDEAFNSVSHFLVLAKSGFYSGLKVFKAVKFGFLRTGCPYNKGYGTAGYVYKREKTERLFDLGSIGLANAPPGDAYAGSQIFIALASLPDFKEQFTNIGEIITKLDRFRELFQDLQTTPDNAPSSEITVSKVKLVTLSDKEILKASETYKPGGEGKESEKK